MCICCFRFCARITHARESRQNIRRRDKARERERERDLGTGDWAQGLSYAQLAPVAWNPKQIKMIYNALRWSSARRRQKRQLGRCPRGSQPGQLGHWEGCLCLCLCRCLSAGLPNQCLGPVLVLSSASTIAAGKLKVYVNFDKSLHY